MPVFNLGEEPVFPPAEMANPDGILAMGGRPLGATPLASL